ncbi:MAG: response regulator [Myxococcales bacterium]|nr:MAG: response regulator [Myxococcales bacterium]
MPDAKSPNPPRILAVEDDRELSKVFVALLTDEGFHVQAEYNGKSALDRVTKEAFDFAFIDGLLPGMDGFKLCENLRLTKNGAELPIVFVSGVYRAANHAVEAKQKYRLLEYLEKPVNPGIVIELLKRHFGDRYPAPPPKAPAEAKSGEAVLANDYFLLDPSQLPLEGALATTPFPLLIGQIYARKLTGQLLLTESQSKKLIAFDNGAPVASSSNIIPECLGQMLLREGRIPQQALDESLKRMKATRRKQGAVLIELGVFPEKELGEALSRQFNQKLLNVFTWADASFVFKPLSVLPENPNRQSQHPYPLIREGVARRLPLAAVQKWLAPYQALTVVATEDAEARLQSCGCSTPEVRFVLGMDGEGLLEHILASGLKPRDEMQRFIFSLVAIGAARFSPPREASSAPKTGREALDGSTMRQNILTAHIQKHFAGEAGAQGGEAQSDGGNPTAAGRPETTQNLPILPPEQMDAYLKLSQTRQDLAAKNCFDMLGVARDTPVEEVKKVYLKLARIYHPDAMPFSDAPQIRRLADEVFAMLAKANDTLTNPDKRAEYLQFLEDGGDQDATDEVARLLAAEQHFMEGQAHVRRKDWARARQSFQEALRLAPINGEYHIELGWAHFNVAPRDPTARQEALQYLQKAMEIAPKLADAPYYAGMIHKYAGDALKAAEWFRKALQANPDHTRSQEELGMVKPRREEGPARKGPPGKKQPPSRKKPEPPKKKGFLARLFGKS